MRQLEISSQSGEDSPCLRPRVIVPAFQTTLQPSRLFSTQTTAIRAFYDQARGRNTGEETL